MWQNHAFYKEVEVCDASMLTRFYSPGRTQGAWVYQSPCKEAEYTFQMFVLSQSFAGSGVGAFSLPRKSDFSP